MAFDARECLIYMRTYFDWSEYITWTNWMEWLPPSCTHNKVSGSTQQFIIYKNYLHHTHTHCVVNFWVMEGVSWSSHVSLHIYRFWNKFTYVYDTHIYIHTGCVHYLKSIINLIWKTLQSRAKYFPGKVL